MDKGILISLIIGGAQIIGSLIVLVATIINSKVGKLHDDKDRLKDENDKLTQKIIAKETQISKMAHQIYFLRFVEESICNELAEKNSEFSQKHIKTQIRKAVSANVNISYVDNDIKNYIDSYVPITPISIDSYYIK